MLQQFAFDSMPHDLIKSSMLGRGVSPHDVGLYLRELSAIKAQIMLPMVCYFDLLRALGFEESLC